MIKVQERIGIERTYLDIIKKVDTKLIANNTITKFSTLNSKFRRQT